MSPEGGNSFVGHKLPPGEPHRRFSPPRRACADAHRRTCHTRTLPEMPITGAPARPEPPLAHQGQLVHPPGCVVGCQYRSRSVRSGRPATAASVCHLRTEASNFHHWFLPRQSAPAQNMPPTVRACRRQANTTLAATPLRRATSVTLAPATSPIGASGALLCCLT
jgi:hypothetical protein